MSLITKWHDYSNGYVALLDVEVGNLPTTVDIDGVMLRLKSEFHISLMCVKKLALMLDDDVEQSEARLLHFFTEFTKTHPLNGYSPFTEFRLVTKDERKTVVGMVDFPHINELYSALRSEFDVDFPTQPTHVTLFTLQPEKGIGILSDQELSEISHKISLNS